MLQWQDHIQVADKTSAMNRCPCPILNSKHIIIVNSTTSDAEWQDHILVADKNLHVSLIFI